MTVVELKKRRNQVRTKQTLKSETKKTVRHLIITLSIMIVVLMSAFLYFTSESSQQGYALQQEKLYNEHLKTIQDNLKTKITESTSFPNIENSEKVEAMQPLEEKDYVTEEDNSL